MDDQTQRSHPAADPRAGAPDLSVVVPVYRNRDTLEELVGRLRQALIPTRLRHEIILVCDACPDGSWEVAQRLAAEHSVVAALDLRRNIGQHGACLMGLAEARGAWCTLMDADLQDPPEAVPRLLEARSDAVAAVFAARRGRYESAPRMLTSRLFKAVQSWITGAPIDAGMFVLLRRDLVERLLSQRTRHPMLVTMIGLTGMPTASVPTERARRASGTSAYSGWGRLRSGLRAMACVAATRLASPPTSYLGALAPTVVRARAGLEEASP